MQLINKLRAIYHNFSAAAMYQIAVVRYSRRRIQFHSRIKISYSSKLITGGGQIIFKGFAEVEDYALLNAYNGVIEIGVNTYIGPFSTIYGQGNVTIGDNVLIGPGARILSSDHSIHDKTKPIRSLPDVLKPTQINNDVWIGANAVILGGVTVGKGAVIGASSIVTKSIPPYAIVTGNPAKINRYRE